MGFDRRWILGGLLIGTGVGLAALATRRPKLRDDTRLLLIGDSLAVGLDSHMRQMAVEEGIAYEGRGISGSRIDQWADDPWLDQTLRDFQPTMVLVSLGTNDEALGPGAVDRQAHDFIALYDKLLSSGADVMWIGPPDLPFESAGIADMIRDNVRYYFESEDYDIPRGPDDLHPTAAGYAGWAGAIWRWLT
jgi:lysophospholipase L1-like esterase